MNTSEIRQNFLNFFESKSHKIVDSAPIVIKNDPTLMFTNAGMNQFKDVFLGNEPAQHKRIADTQKCLRVSGKHNDLEEVGVDTYHHTMFEMLGNWSFGDYYKKEAIAWAWELLTEVYRIDKDRLYVTVFEGDDADGLGFDQDAFDIWKSVIDEDRIIKANKKDNFWEMGEVGPCGPCSEIHVDTRSDLDRKQQSGKDLVNKDHPQVIEIWNLVFMEMRRMADGSLQPLSAKHIDTGMGLERLAMVLQGKHSTYDTDLFAKLIAFIEGRSRLKYQGGSSKQDIAIRVLCDHIRAISFAIADGQMPSNTGPGYVIRRILRRAVRYAYSFLDIKDPFLFQLAGVLANEMGDFFKELKANGKLIQEVIREEEESFLRTLAKGIELIAELTKTSASNKVSGKQVFELYDTFGFPVDLTALILSEQGFGFEMDEFNSELEKQKLRSRKASATSTSDWVILSQKDGLTAFVGYDSLEEKVELLRYRRLNQKGKDYYQLVFDQTPFYPEGGGQVGDRGKIYAAGHELPILNTNRENNLIVHLTDKSPQGLPTMWTAEVAGGRRLATAKNHTATHLLHYALRSLLGNHVEQKGSLVDSGYLRFDFSHFSRVSPDELRQIELNVNAQIRTNIPLHENRHMPIQQALELGAMALFGEKYGSEVRVVQFGPSVELCGGTHVSATGEIGFFKIVSEGSVAAGVRRIEALTGSAAEQYIYKQLDELDEVKSLLRTAEDSTKAIRLLMDQQSALSGELEALKREQAKRIKSELIASSEMIQGVRFIAAKVDLDQALIKDIAFQLKQELAPAMVVLANTENNKATLAVALSDDIIQSKGLDSNQIVRDLAKLIQGGGGGQAFFATAGGKNPQGVDEALTKARTYLLPSG